MHLLDDEKCFQVVRERRWPEGVRCPHCTSPHVIKQGRDDTGLLPENWTVRTRDSGSPPALGWKVRRPL
ncbi:transposase [Deinococcus sp. S9]|uniref:transposase n=1 Tax=Deinococcus sp. S9 TaxID=2545754 RepID=UPI00352BAFB0